MRTQFSSDSIVEIKTDAVIVGVFAVQKDEPVELTGFADRLDQATGGVITQVIAEGDFTGASKQVTTLYSLPNIAAKRVVLVGLGKKSAFTEKAFIEAVTAGVKATKAKDVVLAAEWLPEGRDEAWALRTALRAVTFATVTPADLKTEAKPIDMLESLTWMTGKVTDALTESLKVGSAMGQAMVWARELAQLPPNFCDPDFMAEAAESLTEVGAEIKKSGKTKPGKITCKVMHAKEIDEAGMGGLLAVSQGSAVGPTFIEVTYSGADKSRAPVVLVGKGITFDAGGISIKPARNMDVMKFDMCGASVVLAAVKAAAEMGLKENVVALVPCAENLPSGTALKPSDVITMANGMTVEVQNTDAEGRLILADALTRACELNPAVCIDVATLTGACIVALGTEVSGLFCDDEKLTDELAAAAESTTDAVWPMPMGGVYREMLESNCADLVNSSWAGNSGASTAATFLKEFAPKCPWAHLDVAGTANTLTGPKRSRARPLPLILEWLYQRAGVEAQAEAVKTQKDEKVEKAKKSEKAEKTQKAEKAEKAAKPTKAKADKKAKEGKKAAAKSDDKADEKAADKAAKQPDAEADKQ